ncbi:acylneuraminate cytidylyltransferase family protein [Cesiribacter andamanensis]|uniref:N-acylneuraminate cytidylyltransferase n=1 Tax=Cesiribacter andamanensis AMV16 TaxID=1279009 RepID=M7N900_9BACT|nr:acylneuraminate cytidylyltransferase family protein [Cesiribacter andamanensis]EMR03686.1 N-acylneuraminate cytidylyltransferase [Cesiribacter andamanensis AMV16]
MKTLYLIPARGGSKGIPGKNLKPFFGKPLIGYAIETALACSGSPADICLSTDDAAIAEVGEKWGLEVPFLRPAELATDEAGTYPVLLHALEQMEQLRGCHYEVLVLLQPTSPFRTARHVQEALALYGPGLDGVVSVQEAESNPYFTLFEETSEGWLQKSKKGIFVRRQDCPRVWELNGAVYVLKAESLRKYQSLAEFQKLRPYEMSRLESADLDTPLDWKWAKLLVQEGLVSL